MVRDMQEATSSTSTQMRRTFHNVPKIKSISQEGVSRKKNFEGSAQIRALYLYKAEVKCN